MKFTEEKRSETINFRVTPAEREFLQQRASELDDSVAGILRQALDLWLAAQPASGSSESGSSRSPSGVTQNVKAASKRSPSKSKGRTQRSH